MCYTCDTFGHLDGHNHTAPPHSLTGQGLTGQGRQYSHPPGDVGQHQINTHSPAETMYEYDSGLQYSEPEHPGDADQIHSMFIDESSNVRGESLLDQLATDSWQNYQSGYQQFAGDNMGFACQQAEQYQSGAMPMQPQVFEMPHDNISRQSSFVEGHDQSYESQRQHGFLPEQSREDDIDLDEDLEARQLARQKQRPSGSSSCRPAAYSLPWSSWHTTGNHNPHFNLYSDVYQLPGRIEVPTPDVSTETNETNASSWVVLGRMSSRSSFSRGAQEVMASSWMAVCPQDLQASVRPDATVNCIPSSARNPEMLPQGESEAGKHPVASLDDLRLLPPKPTNELPLPPSRSGHSDAMSITGSSRSIPSIIHCQEPGCRRHFSGRYGQGNYARHKRQKHKDPDPIVCESPSCGKVFQRKDARLKHYRKHHRELARDAVLRPKRIEVEVLPHVEIPPASDREFELFRVGSGLSMQPLWDS